MDEVVPAVGVVMLAFGAEPLIGEAIAAVMASRGVDVQLVVVNNGCSRTDLQALCQAYGAALVRPPRNLGFAGGVNLGARHLASAFLGLVNSDAIVDEGALRRLVDVAAAPGVGIASGSIRLGSDPSRMNSAGNPLHFLGLSWAGGLGDAATQHSEMHDVASASGAGLVVRREVWDRLGGFPVEFFAYQEDLDLSWRAWQTGYSVQYVPDAIVRHFYDFSRNPSKMFFLERNRLLFVLTCYSGRTLALLAPVLLTFEVAVVAIAARQRWGWQKLRGLFWVLSHLGWVRRRRRSVQAARVVPDRQLVRLWTDRFDATAMPLPTWAEPLQAVLAGYWRWASRLL